MARHFFDPVAFFTGELRELLQHSLNDGARGGWFAQVGSFPKVFNDPSGSIKTWRCVVFALEATPGDLLCSQKFQRQGNLSGLSPFEDLIVDQIGFVEILYALDHFEF